MNFYEQKRQARIDRLRNAAKRASQESDALSKQAHQMASVIPFGEPIHVGHHSERRDRNYRGRIQHKFEKSFEAQKKAEELAGRAIAAENNTAISSDDPEAVTKLREKLAELEKQQKHMKDVNAAHKRFLKNPASLDKSDLPEDDKAMIKTYQPRYSWEPHPYPPYAMTNNSATIRATKQRIEQLLEKEKEVDKEYMLGEIRVHENVEENRLQLFFSGKPSEEIRSLLKSSGFHWANYNKAWQRQLNNAARWTLESIKDKLHTV